MWSFFERFCIATGLIYVLWVCFGLFYALWRPKHDLYKRYNGGWAVVTGATDGIGLSFCKELARRGFNICVVGRNPEKIDNVKKLLMEINPKISVMSIEANFSDSFKEGFFEDIVAKLKDIDISILVNDVGVLMDVIPFASNSPEDIKNQMTVNMVPTAMLTRLLVPQMLNRPTRSAVITMSSYAVYAHLQNSSDYCSTKGFCDFISRALSCQNGQKIDFLSVRPGLVTTNMTAQTKTLLHASADQCALGALNSVGRKTTSGYWWHQVMAYFTALIPQGVADHYLSKAQTEMGKIYLMKKGK